MDQGMEIVASKYKHITLEEWQNMDKPLNEIIVQPSNPSGNDKSEHYDFSIGMFLWILPY